mgnify:CR=1 FL=1
MAAIPFYYMLGQEPGFLGAIDETYLTQNKDESIDDAEGDIDIYNYTGTAVATYNTTPGAVNSNTQTSNTIISMDTSMFRHLLTMHASGFSVVKRTAAGNVGNSGSNRWGKTYSESYPTFAAADTALRAAITGAGNTVDVKGFFLSFGYVEANTGNSTLDAAFKVDLQQLILDLRTDYGSSTTPVVLDLPPPSVAGYSAARTTSLLNARRIILEICGLGTNISYVSADDLARTAAGVDYTGAALITQGTRMAKEMERLVTGKGTVAGLGAPVVVMFGDDNTTGATSQTFLANIAEPDLDGAITNAKTWNWSSNAWDTLDGTTNSNTSTDGTSTFGPDVSLMDSLLATYPDGVYIFKLGRNNSSLGNASSSGGCWARSAANIYSTVVTEWNLAKQAMLDVEDKIPDVVCLVWMQGQEDVATQTLAEAYASNLTTFAEDYRAIFKTRTDPGRPLPIVVAKMQDTGAYTTEYVEEVQNAVDFLASVDAYVSVTDLSSFATHTNNRTLDGSGTIDAGKSIAVEILGYNP